MLVNKLIKWDLLKRLENIRDSNCEKFKKISLKTLQVI